MDIKRFLEKLASGTPTPGGGSACALAGALSASLVAMVAGLSSKKGKPKQKGTEVMRKRALAAQKRLSQAVAEDATSFDAVMEAYRLPRDTEKERLHRDKMIEKAYRKATATPQLVCEYSLQMLDYSKILISKGNPNAVSDAGVAAFLADAAIAGGLLNIGVNLAQVKEKAFLRKMQLLMEQYARMRNEIMGSIMKAFVEGRPI